MKFLVDMGLDLRVVSWLREQGHDAVHLRDEGLQRLPNGEIFDKATAERRVILTVDLDFGEIAALARGERTSVVVFRLHNTRTAHVIQRLSAVLTDCSNALDQGAVVVVEEGRTGSVLCPSENVTKPERVLRPAARPAAAGEQQLGVCLEAHGWMSAIPSCEWALFRAGSPGAIVGAGAARAWRYSGDASGFLHRSLAFGTR